MKAISGRRCTYTKEELTWIVESSISLSLFLQWIPRRKITALVWAVKGIVIVNSTEIPLEEEFQQREIYN